MTNQARHEGQEQGMFADAYRISALEADLAEAQRQLLEGRTDGCISGCSWSRDGKSFLHHPYCKTYGTDSVIELAGHLWVRESQFNTRVAELDEARRQLEDAKQTIQRQLICAQVGLKGEADKENGDKLVAVNALVGELETERDEALRREGELRALVASALRELNNIREKRCTCPHDYYHGDHHYTYCPASDKSKAASSHLQFPLNRVAYELEHGVAALTANESKP